MNDRQDSVIEKIRENKLDENDTFKFSCNQCGECCRNRHDILLPPHDIYRIAKYLKKGSDKDVILCIGSLYMTDRIRTFFGKNKKEED